MPRIFLASLLLCALASPTLAQSIRTGDGFLLGPPPPVETHPVTDNYRWLEDAKSPETRAFIDDENAYTARYLKSLRIRPDAVDDLTALEAVTHWTMPIQRGNDYYFMKRLSDEGQASIYVRHGWTGKDERLLDPAVLSRDPNTSIELADVSRDGSLIAYHVRQSGNERQGTCAFLEQLHQLRLTARFRVQKTRSGAFRKTRKLVRRRVGHRSVARRTRTERSS